MPQRSPLGARARANVALVKYWGKRDAVLNLPAAGSISLTLDGLEAAIQAAGADGVRWWTEELASLVIVMQSLFHYALTEAEHLGVNLVKVGYTSIGRDFLVDMVDAYDPALRQALLAAADAAGVVCHQGVYIWFSGPSFETPAEIRAARVLGADAVGMSTAPETILARHVGMKVAALSLMTNYAAGLVPGALGHDHTVAVASASAGEVQRLLWAFLEAYR